MLAIRFVRIGKKGHPLYRIIVQEKGKNPHSSYLENLGIYNPHTKENNIKKDRADYWLSKGAELSATVNNLFVDQGLIKAKKVRASKSQPGKKKQAQLAVKQAEEAANKKAQAAAEAKAAESQEVTVTETVATAPIEETPAE